MKWVSAQTETADVSTRSLEKHFLERSAKLQIPPRHAGTGRLRIVFGLAAEKENSGRGFAPSYSTHVVPRLRRRKHGAPFQGDRKVQNPQLQAREVHRRSLDNSDSPSAALGMTKGRATLPWEGSVIAFSKSDRGATPLRRPTYALANVGHPSSSSGLVATEGTGLLRTQDFYRVYGGGARRGDS
jgi:hypothetical protein